MHHTAKDTQMPLDTRRGICKNKYKRRVVLRRDSVWACSKTLLLWATCKILNYHQVLSCALLGDRTLVPNSWMCKKQTMVSHSSAEADIIHLDAGLRTQGLRAFVRWACVVLPCHQLTKREKTPRAIIHILCKYSQFQHLTECSRQHISPTTSKAHDFQTTPATKGWRFALMAPWASRQIGGSHRCPQRKAVGSQKAPQTTTTRQQDTNTLLKTYMAAEPVR